MKEYVAYTLRNFRQIEQMKKLPEEEKFAIEVVGQVLPFKTNNYVVEDLINWDNVPDDPMYRLTFPQRDMLLPEHFDWIAGALRTGKSPNALKRYIDDIHRSLNPHPAGQLEQNMPKLDGRPLHGIQHKYAETVLFFPSHGQTCHAYCSFCFRWPQFVGDRALKFANRQADMLVNYLRQHAQVTDVLITGGDPMVMRSQVLQRYVEPLLSADLPNLQTIRFGTKSLSFWPRTYLTEEGEALLRLFETIVKSGMHLAIMAHFSHPVELSTPAVAEAIRRIRATGAQIRTQSPILRHINDDPLLWTEMWQKQVRLGCIPYYMFITRDTGAQRYFAVPLVRAWKVFSRAYRQVSGLARTVRGPSMSATAGKIQVLGVEKVNGQDLLVLTMLQARDPNLVMKPFFAQCDTEALWIDDLVPVSGSAWQDKNMRQSRYFLDLQRTLAA